MKVIRKLRLLRVEQYAHVVKETPDGERRHYYAAEKYNYQKKGVVDDEGGGGRFDSVRINTGEETPGAAKIMAFLEISGFAAAGIDSPDDDDDDFGTYAIVRWYCGLCKG